MQVTGTPAPSHRVKATAFSVFMLLACPAVLAQEDATTETTPEAPATTPRLTKYTCSLNGLVRRVEISYATDSSSVPCDVHYYKDSESPNEVNTLWSAQNLTGYCEQKAGEFVDKLQSWGWQCTAE